MRLYDILIKQTQTDSTKRREELNKLDRLLQNLNPDNIKKRGYACVRKNDTYIGSAAEIENGETVTVELIDGSFDAPVTQLRRN